MAIDLTAFERTVKASSSTWEALGVTYVVHPVSPNHGKPVVWADFEGSGHLATVMSWVSGETELESARVADGRIVNRHYELASSADLAVVLDDLHRLLQDGSIPEGSVVGWHDDQAGAASSTWIEKIVFPESWIDLRLRRDRLAQRKLVARHRKELRREIAPGHVLYGLDWRIIGLGVPARDDVLLRLRDGRAALAHVTWRGAPEPPSWPMTTIVSSIEQLREELEDRGY